MTRAQMSYWWVNHKQTSRQEIKGGYVWSPKREKNGSRSQFYDYMREVRPGDLIVSYANGEIGHYGIVASFPLTAPKPSEFGNAGRNWSSGGWLVGIAWKNLARPFRPKDHIAIIAPLLPDRYSPMRNSGDGNQKAYLTRIDRSLFLELQKIGSFQVEKSAPPDVAFDLIEKVEISNRRRFTRTANRPHRN